VTTVPESVRTVKDPFPRPAPPDDDDADPDAAVFASRRPEPPRRPDSGLISPALAAVLAYGYLE
jgi:hypothetical protein